MRKKRVWIITAGVVLILAALIAGPRGGDPERGPGGTLALRRTLVSLGFDVRDAQVPPPAPATFVLLHDLRDEEGTDTLLSWVESGGRLIVADPDSLAAAQLGVAIAGSLGGLRAATLRPACASAAVGGVRAVVTPGNTPGLESDDPRAISCFGTPRGSFMITVRSGAGSATFLGSASPLTNEFLRSGDNGLFAVNVLGGGGPIAFGPPVAAGEAAAGQGLWSALPGPAKLVVLQLVVALLLFALVRGRRMGLPRSETPPSPISAAELVRATARLLRASRDAGHAGVIIREHAARRVSSRLGISPHDADSLATYRSDDLDEIRQVLNAPNPSNDDELIALALEIERTRRSLEGADV